MPEIISIHIPKTGGSSLFEILQQQYGVESCLQLWRKTVRAMLNERGVIPAVPEDIRVIHGHFRFSEIQPMFEKGQTKVITWLRDPVDRVISRYYFFQHNAAENERHPKRSGADITLLEFASQLSQRNQMSAFLDGIGLTDLFFVGLLHRFETDLESLGAMLGWVPWKAAHLKNNAAYKTQRTAPHPTEIQAVKQLNILDMELYERALRLRNVDHQVHNP